MKQKIFYEDNLSSLESEIAQLNLQSKNILVVTGSASYETSGAKALIEKLLGNYNLIFFNELSANPKIEELQKAVNKIANTQIDFITAIGGGSVIDMAKLIKCYINYDGDITEYVKQNRIFSKKDIPFLAIPTTAGSGSESTPVAIVYIDKCKYSVRDNFILPNYVLLDPSLTYGSPRYLTACVGADALCQAIESFWSVNSTEESRKYAKDAIILLWANLTKAVEDDKEAKNAVMFAANLAGRAINISLTTAPHALSYGITMSTGAPHGHAVALTLPYFLGLNLKVTAENCNDNRGEIFVREQMNELLQILGFTPENAVSGLSLFFDSIFESKNLEIKNKITDEIKTRLASSVDIQRLQNNPVKITKAEIEAALNESFKI